MRHQNDNNVILRWFQICIDCEKKNPRWSSLHLGIHLCIDCAGKHRQYGVAYSFVKSTNLDSWKRKQIMYMQKGSKGYFIFQATPEHSSISKDVALLTITTNTWTINLQSFRNTRAFLLRRLKPSFRESRIQLSKMSRNRRKRKTFSNKITMKAKRNHNQKFRFLTK